MGINPKESHGICATAGNKKLVRGLMVKGVMEQFGFDKSERIEFNGPLSFLGREGCLLADGERVLQLLNERVFVFKLRWPLVLDVERVLPYGLPQGNLKILNNDSYFSKAYSFRS